MNQIFFGLSSTLLFCVFVVGCSSEEVRTYDMNETSSPEIAIIEWVWGELGRNLELRDASQLPDGLIDRLIVAYEQNPYPPALRSPDAYNLVFRNVLLDLASGNTVLLFDFEYVSDIQVVFEVDSDWRLAKNYLVSAFGR